MLSVSTGTRGKSSAKWLEHHPEAKDFIEEWLKMVKSGETDWSSAEVLEHLREEFSFPFTSQSMFRGMVARVWPDLA